MREWVRATPAAWDDALARVSGTAPNERVPWLKLVWEPGEPWESVERWLIYEMLPVARLLADPSPRNQEAAHAVLADLRGPPPAVRRSWDVVDGKRVMRSGSRVTQREWELYRTTGCYGRPYWVIQGQYGGHKRWFNPIEQRLLRLAGKPTAPPMPGDLPYADWDQRVADALSRERALLEQQTLVRNIENRTAEVYQRELQVRERTLAKDLLGHLDQQLRAAVEDVRYRWNPSDLPEGKPITDEDMESAEESFVRDASVFAYPEP